MIKNILMVAAFLFSLISLSLVAQAACPATSCLTQEINGKMYSWSLTDNREAGNFLGWRFCQPIYRSTETSEACCYANYGYCPGGCKDGKCLEEPMTLPEMKTTIEAGKVAGITIEIQLENGANLIGSIKADKNLLDYSGCAVGKFEETTADNPFAYYDPKSGAKGQFVKIATIDSTGGAGYFVPITKSCTVKTTIASYTKLTLIDNSPQLVSVYKTTYLGDLKKAGCEFGRFEQTDSVSPFAYYDTKQSKYIKSYILEPGKGYWLPVKKGCTYQFSTPAAAGEAGKDMKIPNIS